MEALEKANQQYLYTLKGLTYQVQMLKPSKLPSRAERYVKTKRESRLC